MHLLLTVMTMTMNVHFKKLTTIHSLALCLVLNKNRRLALIFMESYTRSATNKTSIYWTIRFERSHNRVFSRCNYQLFVHNRWFVKSFCPSNKLVCSANHWQPSKSATLFKCTPV